MEYLVVQPVKAQYKILFQKMCVSSTTCLSSLRVQKGSTCTNAANSVAGIARAIYERTFRIMVEKCNETLCDPTMKKVTYIGVLDIAGFEIFDYNGFEQICINYVNEKLQQFFNQHM